MTRIYHTFQRNLEPAKKGRPKKYGEKVDVKNLNPEHFKKVENNQAIFITRFSK
jgi:hypothetical protein